MPLLLAHKDEELARSLMTDKNALKLQKGDWVVFGGQIGVVSLVEKREDGTAQVYIGGCAVGVSSIQRLTDARIRKMVYAVTNLAYDLDDYAFNGVSRKENLLKQVNRVRELLKRFP